MRKDDLKTTILNHFKGNFHTFFARYLPTLPEGKTALISCPFHKDTKASFSLDLQKGLFHCFGCGVGGDIFKFYALLKGLDPKADFVKILKGIASDFNLSSSSSNKRIVKTYDYRDESGKLLFQVVRYEPKDFRQRRPNGKRGWIWNLNGVKRVLYRLPELIAGPDPVLIPEGEKDVDRLVSLGLTATTNSGGAKTWLEEYNSYLEGREVVILPDFDESGQRHMQKVASSLIGCAKLVKVVILPNLGEKEDVSDWLANGGTKEKLLQLIDETPEWRPQKEEIAVLKGPVSYKEVEDTVTAWLVLQSTDAIRVVLAAVIANKLSGDPMWLFVIAPPSSAKTEIIRALDGIDNVYPLSSLTGQTLVSGMKGPDRSLLPKLDGKILTLKDFTTVLSMHRETRQEILSQLREIADGSFVKAFGTGKEIRWRGKVGFIAGVTEVIDTHYAIYQVLGERFVQYRIAEPDPKLVVQKARSNAGQEDQMRNELREVFANFIAGIEVKNVTMPEEIGEKFDSLVQLCVIARTGIMRDPYGNKEIVYVPRPEGPARLAKQLNCLGQALALLRGSNEITEDDYRILYRIGMDSIPKQRLLTINALRERNTVMTTTDVSIAIDYPTNTARRFLQELHALKLVDREPGGQGCPDKWELSLNCKILLDEATPPSLENSLDGV